MSDEFVLEDAVEAKENHHKTPSVKIPPDVYPYLLKVQIQPPANGIVKLEWDKEKKRIRITTWNKDKPRKENKADFWTCGKDTFRKVELHYRKGKLVRVCR
jgi:hypothetical protein